MKLSVYSERGLGIDLDCISENVSRLAPDISVVKGRAAFALKGFFVSHPSSYKQLSRELLREAEHSDAVLLFTDRPYDNNFFWEELDDKAIISLSGWNHLTNLPLNNGAVFFACAAVMQALDIDVRHDDNTGCVNDFWMDKTGVDLGMRSGSVCSECLAHYRAKGDPSHAGLLSQVQTILAELAAASRTDMDICDYWRMRPGDETFDVFLCHNSREKDDVRDMNSRLKRNKIATWFDEEQLPPGRLWQELLEEQIGKIKCVAIFVGSSGIGPWQDIELRAFLSEFVKRRCPVIPVILPNCATVPRLPLFLSQFTWVDFRRPTPDPFSQLVWGITGRRP